MYMKREDFFKLLESNENVIVFFITATWCAPCQTIKSYVHEKSKEYEITFVQLDVDQDSDVCSMLKSKKQFKGVPSLLAYTKKNVSFNANLSISGTNKNEIDCFFESLDFL
jgi:thiol-disulfide isomerase/thioredoxin